MILLIFICFKLDYKKRKYNYLIISTGDAADAVMTLPPLDELPKRVTHDQMPLTSALLKLGSGQGIYFSSSFLIHLKISIRF